MVVVARLGCSTFCDTFTTHCHNLSKLYMVTGCKSVLKVVVQITAQIWWAASTSGALSGTVWVRYAWWQDANKCPQWTVRLRYTRGRVIKCAQVCSARSGTNLVSYMADCAYSCGAYWQSCVLYTWWQSAPSFGENHSLRALYKVTDFQFILTVVVYIVAQVGWAMNGHWVPTCSHTALYMVAMCQLVLTGVLHILYTFVPCTWWYCANICLQFWCTEWREFGALFIVKEQQNILTVGVHITAKFGCPVHGENANMCSQL
jgi:hypothetical protein